MFIQCLKLFFLLNIATRLQREVKCKEDELSVSLKQLKTWEKKWLDQQKHQAEILQQSKLRKSEIHLYIVLSSFL